MRVYIPSYNRAESITTHKLFKDSNLWPIVNVHNLEQAKQYIKAGVPEDIIGITGLPLGISGMRNYIKQEHKKHWPEDKWIIMADDNIQGFNIYPEPYYNCKSIPRERKELRRILEDNYPPIERLEEIINQTIAKAEEVGAGFCGFGTIENYYFRNNKWKQVSMVCSKFCLVKLDELEYDTNVLTMDDYEYSCKNLVKYGKVLVNAYVWPKAGHNQTGGLGKLSERADKKVADCKYINEKYPGLFRFKERKNSVPGGEIVLRGYTQSFIKNWKAKNGIA